MSRRYPFTDALHPRAPRRLAPAPEELTPRAGADVGIMQLGRDDLSLLPLEGLSRRVVGGDEGVDGLAQLPGRGEAGPKARPGTQYHRLLNPLTFT